jgi:uncharacterized protein YoxC
MKAIRPGPTIGKALENYSNSDPTQVGKILAFVNVSYADPNNVLANLMLGTDGSLIVPKIKTASLTIDPTLDINSSEATGSGSLDSSTLDQSGTLASGSTPSDSFNLSEKLNTIQSTEATNSAQLADLTSQVAGIATQSGELTSKLQDTSDKLASASANISSQSAVLASLSDDVSKLKLTPPSTLFASDSATLNKLNIADTLSTLDLRVLDATVSGTLKSFGNTFLANTTIAGDLSVDGLFSITNGDSINSLPALHIQSSPLASLVDFFNGLVKIDNTGTLVVQKLSVSDKTLSEATIPAGQTKVTIPTTQITSASNIFTSSNTLTDKTLAVINQKPGLSFDVAIVSPSNFDIIFKWWIVDSK